MKVTRVEQQVIKHNHPMWKTIDENCFYSKNLYTTDESYTSGTSFLDGEVPCKENYDKSRRIHRGMFQSSDRLINSDVNGSLQIMRKAFPDAFNYGIEGNLTPTIINVTKVA